MRETWMVITEYAARVMSGADWRVYFMLLWFVALLAVLAYYNSDWHMERAVSKRRFKAKKRRAKELTSATITDALEDQVKRGQMTREEVDAQYKILREAGYLDIGIEPTYGKPWWFPKKAPDLAASKKAAWTRLHNMGVNVRDKLNSMRKETLAQRKIRLMATLKPSK